MAFNINDLPAYVAAVGALGLASFGAVEALGKTLFVFDLPLGMTRLRLGLPYVGFGKVQPLAKAVGPAMAVTYGDGWEALLRSQYRAGRGKGQAPDSLRQGVRLGLPFLDQAKASAVIGGVWGMSPANSDALAAALTAVADAPAGADTSQAQALAGRFATALDTRIQAAFDAAEAVYKTRAQFWAALVAIAMSLGYHASSVSGVTQTLTDEATGWTVAFLVGLVAVPLAPVAKDLSSSLSDALDALGKLRAPAGK